MYDGYDFGIGMQFGSLVNFLFSSGLSLGFGYVRFGKSAELYEFEHGCDWELELGGVESATNWFLVLEILGGI